MLFWEENIHNSKAILQIRSQLDMIFSDGNIILSIKMQNTLSLSGFTETSGMEKCMYNQS